jgi:outer membrane autotransporter protein
MAQTSGTDIDGKGWMVGPYVTTRLGENLFWQGRAGWGQSNNDIVAAGTGTFDSSRWLVSSSLTGRWQIQDGLAFAPTASFIWFKDDAKSYVDSMGTVIPSVSTETGQLMLSPALSYVMTTDDGLRIEPSLATELLWNFASTNASGLGNLGDGAAGTTGLRGRIKAGLGLKTPSGTTIGINASYDGIGISGYSAIAGQATVIVPLD